MDKSIVGGCRVGFFRVGVITNEFEGLKKRLENIATPINPILLDGSELLLLDGTRECRLDVYTNIWRDLKERFKKVL